MIPKIFEGWVGVRFSDLDIYGHVNAKNYLDYVNTVRFRYIEEHSGMSNQDIMSWIHVLPKRSAYQVSTTH